MTDGSETAITLRDGGRVIDLFYSRPGCESCDKVRAEIELRGARVREERTTRAPLSEREARALLERVDEVTVLRGRRQQRRPGKEVAVADLLGPTGKIRAPLLRRGRRLLVGFETSSLKEWLDRS